MTADDIATFQTGTHPALTASPIAYQLVNAAENAVQKMISGEALFMKVGLIRCMQTEDMCPGTTDFKVIKKKRQLLKVSKEKLKLSV
jgi:hypothetical protein